MAIICRILLPLLSITSTTIAKIPHQGPVTSFICASHSNKKCMTIPMLSSKPQLSYTPMTELIKVPPSTLVASRPRLAKDVAYASTIQQFWRGTSSSTQGEQECSESVGTPYTYKCVDNSNIGGSDNVFHGFIVRPLETTKPSSMAVLPGIIFFHTAAGPHDVFLRWIANRLVSELNCIVFIADLLSDSDGWGWDEDRTTFQRVSQSLLHCDETTGARDILQKRINGAIDALKGVDGVDATRLAATGWCMGGKPILEMALRMNLPEIKALASFHGVFGDVLSDCGVSKRDSSLSPRLLICNGNDDPFVSKQDVKILHTVLSKNYWPGGWTFMGFDGARHGFTNPAQDNNPNPNFGYNDDAAKTAYNAFVTLLKDTLN